jgi:sugar transferase (PEP-CTERM system associated)
LLFELLALNCCFFLLIQGRLELWDKDNPHLALTLSFALCCSLMVQFALWSFSLYSREVIYSGQRLLSNLIAAAVFSSLLLLPVCYLFSLSGHAPFMVTVKFYGFALLGFASLIALERFMVLKLFEDAPYMGNTLILGTGPATDRLIEDTIDENERTYRLAGIVSENPREVGSEIHGHRVIGAMTDLRGLLATKNFETIVISNSVYSPSLPVNDLLKAKVAGARVIDAGEFFEKKGRKILLEKLDPVQLLLSENLRMTRFRWFLKDSIEKLLAILLFIATSPLALAATILIKLSSPGPIFYRQKRVGKDGMIFEVIKFRTMNVDAEGDGKARWAQKHDDRVTWIGRILRKTRIDELPQILNVLKGEMAFVGPRPERPEFVQVLDAEIPFYSQRHLVKPGLTGWAQVCYPYGASVEDAREKLRYDLYYIKHMSLFFDLMIVLATIRTVLFKAYGR